MNIRKRVWVNRKGAEQSAWQVLYRDQSGKRRSKQFERKKDAERWVVTAAWEVSRGIHTPDSSSITVAEAAKQWLSACEVDELEPSTLAAYEQHVRLHITPLCGSMKISQLSTPIVEGYRDKLVATLSRPMAIRVLRSFKAIISEAMRKGLISQNVALPVKIKRQTRQKTKICIPSKRSIRSILLAAQCNSQPIFAAIYCLLIFGGLRASELRGLSWSSVNLSASTVEVKQRAPSSGVIGPPKSRASHRIIPLPEMAITALKAWKLACPLAKSDLVFPSLSGRPMSWNYMVEHLFYPVQIEAGEFETTLVKGKTVQKPLWSLHDFRHAAASLWIEQGVNPKRVQYLMGHSSITVTFDTYGHLFEQIEQDKQTSSAIQNALFSDAT